MLDSLDFGCNAKDKAQVFGFTFSHTSSLKQVVSYLRIGKGLGGSDPEPDLCVGLSPSWG